MNQVQPAPLSLTERKQFKKYDSQARKNLPSFDKLAEALRSIRDGKLYREKWITFEDYCVQRLKIHKTRAYQICQQAAIIDQISEGSEKSQANETKAVAENKMSTMWTKSKTQEPPGPTEARALLTVRQELRPVVWKAAAEKAASEGRTPTAKDVAEAAQKPPTQTPAKGSPKPPPILDDIGSEVKPEALPFWNRRQEIQDLMTRVSEIKNDIKKQKDANDLLFAQVSNAIIPELELIHSRLRDAKPYVLCTTCEGVPSFQPKGCNLCMGTGLIGKRKSEEVSRREVLEMRMKVNAARK